MDGRMPWNAHYEAASIGAVNLSVAGEND